MRSVCQFVCRSVNWIPKKLRINLNEYVSMDSFRDKQDTVAIVVHVLLRAMTMSLLTLPTFRDFSVQDIHVIRFLRFGAKKLLNIFPVKDGSLEV